MVRHPELDCCGRTGTGAFALPTINLLHCTKKKTNFAFGWIKKRKKWSRRVERVSKAIQFSQIIVLRGYNTANEKRITRIDLSKTLDGKANQWWINMLIYLTAFKDYDEFVLTTLHIYFEKRKIHFSVNFFLSMYVFNLLTARSIDSRANKKN